MYSFYQQCCRSKETILNPIHAVLRMACFHLKAFFFVSHNVTPRRQASKLSLSKQHPNKPPHGMICCSLRYGLSLRVYL